MRTRPPLFLPVFTLLWLAWTGVSSAQISATLRFAHETYLASEQILATLTVTNLAGRDIVFEDGITEDSWCHIQVKALRSESPNYRVNSPKIPELFLKAGETVSRTIPVNEFFELPSTGQFSTKVSLSYGPSRSQFVTPAAFFTLDPGHKIWSTTVGVPEGQQDAGTPRLFSVLSLQRRDGMFLYAKLENTRDGFYYPPYFLGRMLAAMAPQMQIDRQNNLYILHASSDDTYILSQIDVADGRSGQAVYRSKTPRKGRPSLSRQPDGRLAISGGILVTEGERIERAKLSSRPEGFKPIEN